MRIKRFDFTSNTYSNMFVIYDDNPNGNVLLGWDDSDGNPRKVILPASLFALAARELRLDKIAREIIDCFKASFDLDVVESDPSQNQNQNQN